jgi:trans-aconitate methyltransferase
MAAVLKRRLDESRIRDLVDFGCGSGLSTAWLVECFPLASVVGVDASPIAVEMARSAGLNVRQVIPRNEWSLDAESCDAVFAAFVFQLPVPIEDIGEVFRVLRRHGYLIFNVETERAPEIAKTLASVGFIEVESETVLDIYTIVSARKS